MTTKRKIRSTARRLLLAGAVTAGVLVPASAAVAQEYPTPSTTPPVPSTSSTQVSSGGASTGGTLPVTGGELAGMTLAGLGVTGAGVALVAAARRRPQRVEARS